MVGATILADVKGPESVGIKGILVRGKNGEGIKFYSSDLLGVKKLIG